MSKYLAECPKCEKEISLHLTTEEAKLWEKQQLQIECPECKEVIKPKHVFLGSPIHTIKRSNK